jgi:hypothetical protein
VQSVKSETGTIRNTGHTLYPPVEIGESNILTLYLFWTLDLPGHRVELLEGQIVVSPRSK